MCVCQLFLTTDWLSSLKFIHSGYCGMVKHWLRCWTGGLEIVATLGNVFMHLCTRI